jgi:hypothetical protein
MKHIAPKNNIGDMYGGAHYIRSGSATLQTLRGQAMIEAATKVGRSHHVKKDIFHTFRTL